MATNPTIAVAVGCFFVFAAVLSAIIASVTVNDDANATCEFCSTGGAHTCTDECSQWVLKVSKDKNTTKSCAAADEADTVVGCPIPTHPTWTQYPGGFPAECGCAPAEQKIISTDNYNYSYPVAVPDALTPKYSACGCVTDPSQVEGGLHVDKVGCSAGNGIDAMGNVIPGNPLGAKFLDHYPWCYMKSTTSCGAAFPNPKQDQPGIRFCGAWTGGDACTGPHCESLNNGTPASLLSQGTLKDFIQNFLKDDVKQFFNAHNVLQKIQEQQKEVADIRLAGAQQQHWTSLTEEVAYFRAKATIILPTAFLEGDNTPIGNEDIADWVDYIGRPDGTPSTPYAGELFNGFNWTTGLDNETDSVHDTVVTAVPSCSTPPFYDDGWSDETLVLKGVAPPLPCVCAGKCQSSLAYGDGTYFSVERKDRSPVFLGKVKWWIPALDDANIYITTGA